MISGRFGRLLYYETAQSGKQYIFSSNSNVSSMKISNISCCIYIFITLYALGILNHEASEYILSCIEAFTISVTIIAIGHSVINTTKLLRFSLTYFKNEKNSSVKSVWIVFITYWREELTGWGKRSPWADPVTFTLSLGLVMRTGGAAASSPVLEVGGGGGDPALLAAGAGREGAVEGRGKADFSPFWFSPTSPAGAGAGFPLQRPPPPPPP